MIARLLGWGLVIVSAIRLLRSAHIALRRLPSPTKVVPSYALWMPQGGTPPNLQPPPSACFIGPAKPNTHVERILILSPQVKVVENLPGRLQATGSDFVSVLPQPRCKGTFFQCLRQAVMGTAIERLWRDSISLEKINDLRSPEAFADARIAWILKSDLDALSARPEDVIVSLAMHRKACTEPIDLRDGRAVDTPTCAEHGCCLVSSTPLSWTDHRTKYWSLFDGDKLSGLLFGVTLSLGSFAPFLCLFFDSAFALGCFSLGLQMAARLMLAQRDGFGLLHIITGLFLDPWLVLAGLCCSRSERWTACEHWSSNAQDNTAPLCCKNPPWWISLSAIASLLCHNPHSIRLALRLENAHPEGRGALGRYFDRAILNQPLSRALGWRRRTVLRLAKHHAYERLMVCPVFSFSLIQKLAIPSTILIDCRKDIPKLAASLCPTATVFQGDPLSAPIDLYQLVIACDFAESLDDHTLIHQLSAIRGRLSGDGTLIISTTTPNVQTSNLLLRLGWEGRWRSPDAFLSLLDAAGFALESRYIDPFEIQAIFVARPRPTGRLSLHGN